MKKVLPFIAPVGLLLLSNCGTSIEEILATDDDEWRPENKSSTTTYTFFDDETFSRYNSKISDSGAYSYDEDNKKLTLNIKNKE